MADTVTTCTSAEKKPKRGPTSVTTDLEKKRKKAAANKTYREGDIRLGVHTGRWNLLRNQLQISNAQLAARLLDMYEYTDGCIADLQTIKHQVGLGEYLESWMTLRRQLSLGDMNLVKLLLQCYHAVKDCSQCSELVFLRYQKQDIAEGEDINLARDCENESEVLDLSDREMSISPELERQPGTDHAHLDETRRETVCVNKLSQTAKLCNTGTVKESAEPSIIKRSSDFRSCPSQNVTLFFTNSGESSGDHYSSVSSSALKEKSSHSQDDLSFPSPSQLTKDSIQNPVPNTEQLPKRNVMSSTASMYEISLERDSISCVSEPKHPKQSSPCTEVYNDDNVQVESDTLSMECSEFIGTVTDPDAIESSDSQHHPLTACRVKLEEDDSFSDDLLLAKEENLLRAKCKLEDDLLPAKHKMEEDDPDYEPELDMCNLSKKRTKNSKKRKKSTFSTKTYYALNDGKHSYCLSKYKDYLEVVFQNIPDGSQPCLSGGGPVNDSCTGEQPDSLPTPPGEGPSNDSCIGESVEPALSVNKPSVPSVGYRCKVCGYTSINLQQIKRHILYKEIVDMVACSICGRQVSKLGLKCHMRRSHFEEGRSNVEIQRTKKALFCSHENCPFQARNPATLKLHVSSVHMNSRHNACDWEGCEMRFNTPYSLKIHKRTHTDEKPIVCYLCGFRCRQKASLNWHMKSKHPGEPIF